MRKLDLMLISGIGSFMASSVLADTTRLATCLDPMTGARLELDVKDDGNGSYGKTFPVEIKGSISQSYMSGVVAEITGKLSEPGYRRNHYYSIELTDGYLSGSYSYVYGAGDSTYQGVASDVPVVTIFTPELFGSIQQVNINFPDPRTGIHDSIPFGPCVLNHQAWDSITTEH